MFNLEQIYHIERSHVDVLQIIESWDFPCKTLKNAHYCLFQGLIFDIDVLHVIFTKFVLGDRLFSELLKEPKEIAAFLECEPFFSVNAVEEELAHVD